MSTDLFGTDGVRGVANRELTGELAYKLGRAGGHYLISKSKKNERPIFFVGKDTRISGDMLEAALTAGLSSVGIKTVKLGIIPTPGVSYLTGVSRAAGGIMISASHNPIQDNGIKFFNNKGLKLTDAQEDEIEKLIFSKMDEIPYPTHEGIGLAEEKNGLIDKYIEHLLNSVELDLSGLKIVLDCANGAAFYAAPRIFDELGVELEIINNSPDGLKINVESGSTSPEILINKVQESNADLGIANDGDADRVILVDEKGNIIDGDGIMAILSLDLLKRDLLNKKTLVTTANSNLGLKELLDKHGGKMVMARNGDRYVLKKMLENGYNLGGEKSGHIIFYDYNKTGDGILTALQIAEVMVRQDKPLSELAAVFSPWPQRLANVEVTEKEKLKGNEKIKNVVKETEDVLGERGRVFIRPSGTEPVVRIMLEGKEPDKLKKLEEDLTTVIGEELN